MVNMGQAIWPTVVSMLPQPMVQEYGVHVPTQQLVYTMPTETQMPVQQIQSFMSTVRPPMMSRQCAVVTSPPIPQYSVPVLLPQGSPFGPNAQPKTVFSYEVPPPGYSPFASFDCPPPPACACIIPSSFPFQCSQPVSPTVVHAQPSIGSGAVPVPVSGISTVPRSGMTVPIGTAPIPLTGPALPASGISIPFFYNVCTPTMDHRQSYAVPSDSYAAQSTVVTEVLSGTRRTVEQTREGEMLSYMKYSREETVHHNTFQKPKNNLVWKNRRDKLVNPRYRTKLCNKFSENGDCPYGDLCQFIHELPPKKTDETKSPVPIYYEETKVKSECGTQTRQLSSPPSVSGSSPDNVSRLFSSTPISIPGKKFRQQAQAGSDPRIPPGKKVVYFNDFNAGYKKPKVLDGAHSAPLVRVTASAECEGGNH
ncbi:unnamed protein product [Toxocara canis]|nr:unnamed protein product [Toxocara canis]